MIFSYTQEWYPLSLTYVLSPPFHFSHKLTEHSIPKTNNHRLRLRIIIQCRLTQLPPNPRLLKPTKRQLMMQQIIRVNPNSPRLQRIAHSNSSVQVLGMNSGGKTISGTVAYADGILFGLEFCDGADGTEDLFLHDLHVFADVGEDGGFDEVAFVAFALAADFDFGAGFFAFFDVAVTLC